MHPLLALAVLSLSLLPLALMLEEDSPLDCVPRRSVPYRRDNAHLFQEEGVSNYSTMLLREDLNLLVLGAREAVYALDLGDISKKVSSVKWEVTKKQAKECKNKGRNAETDCKNYIRVLHKMDNGRMYVCGTNAFDPECNYMSYTDGKLTLEEITEDGKGKCPFDPIQRSASIMVDDNLYSATSANFLGSEPILMRSSPVPLRTEFKSSWLHEPTFVSMAQMPESNDSEEGDDDKVYLFFSETAVECDCYNKLVVSRVARVCKGDLGGQRTLQKKWTSFLKARMDCPVLESQLPYIIQDTYRWCDPQKPWKECVFYAIFTPQSDTSDLSAVCAYHVSDISKVFAEGKYKTPVTVETSFVKWVMYSGDVPVPRPGACINNEAREAGIDKTLDLPDRTLQFIKDRPLMDQAIQPIGRRPLLVRRGATFTRIVVTDVLAADGEKYHVMFIGTEDGTMLKAVNYKGEMFIIEEVQVFHPPGSIKTLEFSVATGHLYAGSDYGAAQIPVATCGRSSTCIDCVLSRDPFCVWDQTTKKCVLFSNVTRDIVQNVKDGDASRCPKDDAVAPVVQYIWPGGNLKLGCPSPSNLAETTWKRDDGPVTPSSRFQLLRDGLLILNASVKDSGRYRCVAAERSNAGEYTTTVAEYEVTGSGEGGVSLRPEPRTAGPSVPGLQVVVALLVISLVALLAWNFYKGHIPLPWNCGKRSGRHPQGSRDQEATPNSDDVHHNAERPPAAEGKPLVSGAENNPRNNNHSAGGVSLQFISDESEL